LIIANLKIHKFINHLIYLSDLNDLQLSCNPGENGGFLTQEYILKFLYLIKSDANQELMVKELSIAVHVPQHEPALTFLFFKQPVLIK
jgi:hypothetical protein